MKRYLSGVALAAAALTTLGLGSAVAQSGTASGRWIPPHDTIVKVTGNADDGFGIHRYDGSVTYPAPESEARARCLNYQDRVRKVRCRTEIRTWYADLADMKVALKWAHRSS